MKSRITLPFKEGDTVYTPKGEATVLAWDHTFRVKYKGKSMVNDSWADTYGDFSIESVGHRVFTNEEEAKIAANNKEH